MADALTAAAGRLAANLAELRGKHRLTQAGLAGRAGMPRSTLSHLESGAGNPTLRHLAALSAALGVSLEELVAPPRADCVLVRARDLPRAERGQGSATLVRLLPDALPGLQVERLEFRPGGWLRGTPHVTGAKEYLTCLEGALRLTVAGASYDLGPGDVLAFPGDQPHAYRNPGGRRSAGLSVVALVPVGT